MIKKKPKYSIIIPAYNGVEYLPSCVESIISQDYSDFELIISDDHSTDKTKEYLKYLSQYPNILIVEPDHSLSMAEHWEWALSHAKGTWCIFVGQDDGLQPYFFQLADKLTAIADKSGIRTIMSQRAYYFWKNCEFMYGNKAVRYCAENKVIKLNSKYEALKALLGIQEYLELPQMYTTSIFNKTIIDEARRIQGGKVFTCHPQDANLAAIACSLDNYYLKSFIPLGWVGTSLKSAGLAISSLSHSYDQVDEIKKLAIEYKNKINKSHINYNEYAGDFSFSDLPLYFWQAFLQTPYLRSEFINNILRGKLFKYILFGALRNRLSLQGFNVYRNNEYEKIVCVNKCSKNLIKFIAMVFKIYGLAERLMMAPFRRSRLYLKKKIRRVNNINISIDWNAYPDLSMKKASDIVLDKYSAQ